MASRTRAQSIYPPIPTWSRQPISYSALALVQIYPRDPAHPFPPMMIRRDYLVSCVGNRASRRTPLSGTMSSGIQALGSPAIQFEQKGHLRGHITDRHSPVASTRRRGRHLLGNGRGLGHRTYRPYSSSVGGRVYPGRPPAPTLIATSGIS